MTKKTCPICGDGTLEQKNTKTTFKFDSATLSYDSLWGLCTQCGAELADEQQLDANKQAVLTAKRKHLGAPAPEKIKEWRKRLGITQQKAGQLLAVGPTAFSKYENSAIIPSGPTARLLMLLMASEQSLKTLAENVGIDLPNATSSTTTLSPGYELETENTASTTPYKK